MKNIVTYLVSAIITLVAAVTLGYTTGVSLNIIAAIAIPHTSGNLITAFEVIDFLSSTTTGLCVIYLHDPVLKFFKCKLGDKK